MRLGSKVEVGGKVEGSMNLLLKPGHRMAAKVGHGMQGMQRTGCISSLQVVYRGR